MRKNLLGSLVASFLTIWFVTCLAGCGNTSGPSDPQTGDTTLFPNSALLASPADVNTPQAIVLDARHTGYDSGHIPGAISAPPNMFSDEKGDEKGEVLRPVSELETILGDLGITRDSKIVIYDNTIKSLGAGGRLFWMLEYLGCTDVSVLNGGWDQWIIQELPVETKIPEPLPPVVFTAQINDSISVEKEDVASRLPPGPDFVLVDVRAKVEYQGKQLGNTDPRPGHIPGAINFPYEKCFNADRSVLNFRDLKQLLEANGITAGKDVVAYSTVGKRSGFFYFLTRLMGYTKVENYPGSIVDWGKAGLIDPVTYPMVTEP